MGSLSNTVATALVDEAEDSTVEREAELRPNVDKSAVIMID